MSPENVVLHAQFFFSFRCWLYHSEKEIYRLVGVWWGLHLTISHKYDRWYGSSPYEMMPAAQDLNSHTYMRAHGIQKFSGKLRRGIATYR